MSMKQSSEYEWPSISPKCRLWRCVHQETNRPRGPQRRRPRGRPPRQLGHAAGRTRAVRRRVSGAPNTQPFLTDTPADVLHRHDNDEVFDVNRPVKLNAAPSRTTSSSVNNLTVTRSTGLEDNEGADDYGFTLCEVVDDDDGCAGLSPALDGDSGSDEVVGRLEYLDVVVCFCRPRR